MVSAEKDLVEACRQGQLKKVESLITQLYVGKPLPFEKMMLAAVEKDQSEIVDYCLEKGAPICCHVTNKVAMKRAWQTLRVLVNRGGVDINRDIEGFGDYLLFAVRHDEFHAVSLCLELGADPNLHLFQDANSSIAMAAQDASLNVLKELIKYDAHVRDSNAIVLAAENGRSDVIKLLLEHGADIDEIGVKDLTDPRTKKRMGTPLHKAIGNRHIETIKLLLKHGADVERCDYQGRTSLQWAKELGFNEEVTLLESHLAFIGQNQ